MTQCILCKKEHTKYKANSKTRAAKYCSPLCIKRASYLKTHPDTKSILRGDKTFWKTETGIGYFWEQYVAQKLKGQHLPFNEKGIDVRADIGNIDVKVCNKYGPQWVFNKNKPKPIIDWYYCICLVKGKPVKELLIPARKFVGKGITVGTVSAKYDCYKV